VNGVPYCRSFDGNESEEKRAYYILDIGHRLSIVVTHECLEDIIS